jgi:hypothetical protein
MDVNFLRHLFLTIGACQAASVRSIRGRKLWFIGPFLWAFATFVGGIVTAAVYWAMHHSMLAPVETTDPDDLSPPPSQDSSKSVPVDRGGGN